MKNFMEHFSQYLELIKLEEMISTVEKWSSINSYSYNVHGIEEMASLLKQEFCTLGAAVTEIPLPPHKHIDSQGKFFTRPLGKALCFVKRPKAAFSVLLAGHMDSVYPPDSSFQTSKRIAPNVLCGPAVADMKGGLAVLLKALEIFEQTPFAKNVGWELLINPDEEIGSPGSAGLFEAKAKDHKFGLIFEPSFPDGAFVSARRGSSSYALIARGKAAHVGRDPSSGRNAIHALAEVICEMQKIEGVGTEITFNVGKIEGGGALNIVPDFSLCRFNIRVKTLENLLSFQSQLNNILEKVEKMLEVSFELQREIMRPPKPFDEKTQMLFKGFKECAAELGIEASWRESGGVCDGNLLAAQGLPTIDTLGVIGGSLHTHEEYLLTESLVQRAQLTALFLMKLRKYVE